MIAVAWRASEATDLIHRHSRAWRSAQRLDFLAFFLALFFFFAAFFDFFTADFFPAFLAFLVDFFGAFFAAFFFAFLAFLTAGLAVTFGGSAALLMVSGIGSSAGFSSSISSPKVHRSHDDSGIRQRVKDMSSGNALVGWLIQISPGWRSFATPCGLPT
jgi:hypothetical protein